MIFQLIKPIMLENCVLTILWLNWNQRLGHKKTKLNICHHMLTSSTQLQNGSFHDVERTRTSTKWQKMKTARAKRAKMLFFIVRYANLWGFCCRRRRGCLSSLVSFQTRPVVGGQNNRLHYTNNTPYPERSNGTKSSNWRGNDALGHVKIQIWWLCVNMSQCVICSFSLVIFLYHMIAQLPMAHWFMVSMLLSSYVYMMDLAKHERSIRVKWSVGEKCKSASITGRTHAYYDEPIVLQHWYYFTKF